MINRLSVTNFKAFARADIPLSGYTLLSGLNSTGKSTVLQVLALLRQSRDALTDVEGGGFLLNGDLVEFGTGRDVLHEDYVTDGGSADPRITLTLSVDGTEYSWAATYQRAEGDADLLHLDHQGGTGTELPPILADPGFQYLRADRISPAATYPRSHEAAVRHEFLGAHGEHTVNYLRHFRERLITDECLHHPQAKSRQLSDEVEAWMQDICPGVNLQADAIDGTDLVRLSFQFGAAKAGLSSTNRYRPTNVGFGLTYVLPVVVACLTARPGGLILIENPEAHLHPRGQTAMATLTCAAAATGAQVIVETHSDHVLNGVRLAVKRTVLAPDAVAVLFFTRAANRIGTEILQPRLGADGMISEWPDAFFDEWERALDELLG